MALNWDEIAPFYEELANRPLNAESLNEWLADWTRLSELGEETFSRLAVAMSVDTTDKEAEQRYNRFLDAIFPPAEAAEQKLKQKLLDSKLEPVGFEVPLRNMRAEVALFREENLPLLTQQSKLGTEFDKIIAAQTVQWEGSEMTLTQLRGKMSGFDRPTRERAWRLMSERRFADRQGLNVLWQKFLDVRKQLAKNAGFTSFRDYRWHQLLRFDYTPDDCMRFHEAIEKVVVPAATKLYEKARQRLNVETLRPWDVQGDTVPLHIPALHPFDAINDLENKSSAMFYRVDPKLGDYFETLRRENLLDLENRKGKAPGGYCTSFPVVKRPFIFMNSVGLQDDVQTLLHEAGHCFHDFETSKLTYHQQRRIPMEFAEVASMGMELLAAPYLPAREGGFYSEQDAARARAEHLEETIFFWPYMAVVDAFQHWVYEHHDDAYDPANCDAKWAELWRRFMPGVDWSGLDQQMMTGWHRKLHIFQVPFYYVEYGLAQLGAVQVWRNSLHDQKGAVAAYQRALALGGTVPLPKLYETAGAKLAFDTHVLGEAVALVERTLDELEKI